MSNDRSYKIKTKQADLFLRVTPGHFATSHSHTNYYIDVTTQKTRLSEAQAMAKELASYYTLNAIVDTVLCLDGTEVIGALLAQELTRSNICSMNAHQTVYVVTPEHTVGSQLIFRDNIIPMIQNKYVLVLAASVTTGFTAKAATEAILYYNGHVAGISAIFASTTECGGVPVHAAFDISDLEGYASYPSHECPLCKQGLKIDALVNGFGFSKL